MRVFVPMSNDYLHCLPPFAYLFNKHYSRKQPVVVICYDKCPQNLPPNFEVHSVGKQKRYTYAAGLMRFLSGVPDERFVMIHEDNFIIDRVNVDKVVLLGCYMQANSQVVKINLVNNFERVSHASIGPIEMVKMTGNSSYQFSLTPAIWNRRFMLRFLDPREDIWQTERAGTWRIVAVRREGWDGINLGVKEPLVRYINAVERRTLPGPWSRGRFPPGLWDELSSRGLV